MSWSEVNPGHFQRPIGENEKFLMGIGTRAHSFGREHWSVTSKGTFRLNSDHLATDKIATLFRKAWKALRFQHPSIASTASGDNIDYFVPDTNALEEWTQETFSVHDHTFSSDDLIATLKPARYVTGHLLRMSNEVILHFPHWRTDGFGAMHLLNAFFYALNRVIDGEDPTSLPWGLESARLAPSIERVLNLPELPTPEISAAARKYLASVAHTKGSVGIACNAEQGIAPAGTRSAHLRLCKSTTEAILQACESRDISLTAAVHASCAAVTYVAAPASAKGKHYTSTMRFSLRPHLPFPYNTSQYAAAVYTGGYMFPVPASQSWEQNAVQYEEEYRTGITQEFLRSRRQYAIDVQSMLAKNPPPPSPPPSEIDISSVGDVDLLVNSKHECKEGTTLEVEDVSVGVETLSRQMYCFVWTFRGQLGFNLVFNEAFYEDDFVKGLLSKLETVLVGELGVAAPN